MISEILITALTFIFFKFLVSGSSTYATAAAKTPKTDETMHGSRYGKDGMGFPVTLASVRMP
jgi:hypothetical protein